MSSASVPKTASVVGLGALGIMFGHQMQKGLGQAFSVIVDEQRKATYQSQGIMCNNEPCPLRYITPSEASAPIDLIIFGTKYNGLASAIETARPFVGENTVVMSLLNGVASEDMLSAAYGPEKVLYAIAHGMDALREGRNVEYANMGFIEFGEADGKETPRVQQIAQFLAAAGVPVKTTTHIQSLFWGKLMTNVGVNQTVAAYQGCYRDIQLPGEARDTMIAAMREVMAVSQKNGVNLTEADFEKWIRIIGTVSPDSYPSMRQDTLAKRETEVELFGGTVVRLGKQYGVPTPVNERLYKIITCFPIEK